MTGIAVVLPYRDAAETIEEAVDSVLAQRGVVVRLVAIDDGSQDGSAAILGRLAARHTAIVPLATKGVGIVGALHAGLAACRDAPFVARMDADDVSHPDRLAASHALLASDDRLALVGTRTEVDGGDGLHRYVDWQNSLLAAADHARALFVESPICHPTWLFRRAALDAIGGYRDVAWPEDWDVLLRLDEAGHALAKVPDVLLSWRHRAGRLTFTDARYGQDRLTLARAHFLARRLRREKRAIVVWGAGPTGKQLAKALANEGVRPSLFVDIDPRKLGRTTYGARIVAPEVLDRSAHVVLIAVGTRGARDLIRPQLVARGFRDGEDFRSCA